VNGAIRSYPEKERTIDFAVEDMAPYFTLLNGGGGRNKKPLNSLVENVNDADMTNALLL